MLLCRWWVVVLLLLRGRGVAVVLFGRRGMGVVDGIIDDPFYYISRRAGEATGSTKNDKKSI